MRQVLVAKNDSIREVSGSRIEFYPAKEQLSDGYFGVDELHVTKVSFPFRAKIVSGGRLDMDFTIPQKLAEAGVNLLGAYWDGEMVTAIYKAIGGTSISIEAGTPVLVGTLVEVVSMRQIEERVAGGVVNVDKSGQVVALDMEQPKKTRKPRRK
jgi:hypothetical protein